MKVNKIRYFETELFSVRKLEQNDLPSFHEMQGNEQVMKYTTGKATTLEEDKADLKKVIGHYSEVNNQFWVWAIERKNDQSFVGTCALVGDGKGTYEIGFRFLEKYWGKGYGKEICNELIDYAFCQKEVKNIIAYVDVKNIGSVKILDQSKLAFIKEIPGPKAGSTDRFYKMEIMDEGEEIVIED